MVVLNLDRKLSWSWLLFVFQVIWRAGLCRTWIQRTATKYSKRETYKGGTFDRFPIREWSGIQRRTWTFLPIVALLPAWFELDEQSYDQVDSVVDTGGAHFATERVAYVIKFSGYAVRFSQLLFWTLNFDLPHVPRAKSYLFWCERASCRLILGPIRKISCTFLGLLRYELSGCLLIDYRCCDLWKLNHNRRHLVQAPAGRGFLYISMCPIKATFLGGKSIFVSANVIFFIQMPC